MNHRDDIAAGPPPSHHHDREAGSDNKQYLFDKPINVKILFVCYYSSLAVLLLLDLFVEKHFHFPWEKRFGFYSVFGFVACVALVVAAKYILRPFVKRPEDYYDK